MALLKEVCHRRQASLRNQKPCVIPSVLSASSFLVRDERPQFSASNSGFHACILLCFRCCDGDAF